VQQNSPNDKLGMTIPSPIDTGDKSLKHFSHFWPFVNCNKRIGDGFETSGEMGWHGEQWLFGPSWMS